MSVMLMPLYMWQLLYICLSQPVKPPEATMFGGGCRLLNWELKHSVTTEITPDPGIRGLHMKVQGPEAI